MSHLHSDEWPWSTYFTLKHYPEAPQGNTIPVLINASNVTHLTRVASYTSFGSHTLEGNLGKNHAMIKQNTPALFNDFFFLSIPPTTIPSFQLAMSLVSLQNSLKRRSRPASCASNPPEYRF